jgi:CGNR zinc finger
MAHKSSRPKYHSTAIVPISIDLQALRRVWEIRVTGRKRQIRSGINRRPGSRVFLPVRDVVTGPRRDLIIGWPRFGAFEAWMVREEFLSLETEADFLGFLNRVGSFSSHRDHGGWELDEFHVWQNIVRQFLISSPATWRPFVHKLVATFRSQGYDINRISSEIYVTNTLDFHLRFAAGGPSQAAVIHVNSVVGAILATIQIDHLRRAKFGFCARPDCKKPFEITSSHKRQYCSPYCAHLESLRRMRERQRRKQEKIGGAHEQS